MGLGQSIKAWQAQRKQESIANHGPWKWLYKWVNDAVLIIFKLHFYCHEKALKALQQASFREVGHESSLRWRIPISVFPNDTTGKLAGLLSTLSL